MGELIDGKLVEKRPTWALGFSKNNSSMARVFELYKDLAEPGWYIYVCEDWTGQSSGHIKYHVLRFKIGMPVRWIHEVRRASRIAKNQQVYGHPSVKLREMARSKWTEVRRRYINSDKSQRVE